MGFEPHSVAGSALKFASQLPLRGHSPFGIPCRGSQIPPERCVEFGAGDGI